MIAVHTPSTARIQTRLEKWELKHLRTLAAEQAERIEQLEQQLAWAESAADSWARDFHKLEEHIDNGTADARCIGLTVDGSLLVVAQGALQ